MADITCGGFTPTEVPSTDSFTLTVDAVLDARGHANAVDFTWGVFADGREVARKSHVVTGGETTRDTISVSVPAPEDTPLIGDAGGTDIEAKIIDATERRFF